jgi:hypothetical protein
MSCMLRFVVQEWKFEMKEDNMRYVRPTIINTVAARAAVQGGKQGMPGDSADTGTHTNGAAYEADE